MGRVLLLLVTLLWGGPALAAVDSVPMPAPAAGKGEQCVAPTDIMRRDHPSLLNHQRDQTVRAGIRTRQFSLKECIACHAVTDAKGMAVTYEDPRHFCRVCHDYTAVRIDCFECHASKPAAPLTAIPPSPLAALPQMRRRCTG